jgi:putative uncharacterized protein (fragment)
MKEETAIAEKRGREKGDKNTVQSFVNFFKRSKAQMSEEEIFSAIKDSVSSNFSLSDSDIKAIIHQNMK